MSSFKPRKLQEYWFLILSGLIGAGFGAINDQITCTLSPAYFYYFKNVPYGSGLRWQASAVGFQAGFLVGCLSYAIFLFFNQKRRVPLSYYQLLKMARCPIGWAVVMAVITGLTFYYWRFPFFVNQVTPLVPAAKVSGFLLVWGIHIGLYIGALLGIIQGVIKVHRSMS